MEKTVKNYFILKAKWLPQDNINTFKPFVINLIRTERIETCTIEEFSENYYNKYGYRLEYFILRPILNGLKAESKAQFKNGKWLFNLENIPNVDLEGEAKDFDNKYQSLIKGFVNFCNAPKEINYSTADRIICEFIDDNNFDTEIYTGKGTFLDESDAYRYFLSGYIHFLKQNGDPLFDFLVSLCEGVLIKSYIFNEGLENSAFTNMVLFIDTPIIFRLLGYYGDYYAQEYSFLIKNLVEHNCKIFIFKRNYTEVLHVLTNAEKYVESTQYDMSKASDVCNYFRSQKMTAEDVAEEIELLDSHLLALGIKKYDEEINWEEQHYIENYSKIKSSIIDEYRANGNYYPYYSEDAISIDTDSTMHIYILRKNNDVVRLSDAQYFYISSNFGFVNAIRKYNNSIYKNTISPVVSDAFIGMIISGENSEKAQKITTNRILSFCYSAYKPSNVMLKRFVDLIEQEKDATKITENEYISLRNHPMVIDYLVKSTQNNIEELSNNTVYEVLEFIKAQHIFDAKNTFDRQMDKQAKDHFSEMEELRNQKDAEIKQLQSDNYKLKLQSAIKEYNKYKTKVKIIFGVVLSLIATILLGGTVLQIILLLQSIIPKITILSAILTGLGALITISFEIISYKNDFDKWFIRRLLEKRKQAISEQYQVSLYDIK